MSSFFDDIEENVRGWVQFTEDNLKSYNTIVENYYMLILTKEIVKMVHRKYVDTQKAQENIVQQATDQGDDPMKERLLNSNPDSDYNIISTTNVAGVIDTSDCDRLRKLIFRATRGKAICLTEDIDPNLIWREGIATPKTMYLIIFQSGDFMNLRVKNICDSFMGHIAELPQFSEYQQTIDDLSNKINTCKEVKDKIKSDIKSYFKLENKIPNSEISKLKIFEMYIRKDIIIYKTLNKLVPENQLLHGFFWSSFPKLKVKKKISEIQQRHRFEGLHAFEMTNDVSLKPPTKIISNEFLESFQSIVNTYGVPEYKEVNPAFFTIVTFPFLFGVMFGDVAHGTLLFLFASYLCLYKESLEKSKSMLSPLIFARYLLLMMGFFATF